MTENPDGIPTDFESFRASRRRFLDGLAAEALLTQIERSSGIGRSSDQEETMDPPVVLEDDLAVLVEERRLVLGYFAPGQRDLADVVRERLGYRDEAFGVGRVGRVRITIERAPEPLDAPAEERRR
jgi:hypothetical protein